MEVKAEHARTAASGAAKNRQPGPPLQAVEPAEIDYAPKKMTPRETLVVSLKLAAVSAVVFALFWLAHLKLER